MVAVSDPPHDHRIGFTKWSAAVPFFTRRSSLLFRCVCAKSLTVMITSFSLSLPICQRHVFFSSRRPTTAIKYVLSHLVRGISIRCAHAERRRRRVVVRILHTRTHKHTLCVVLIRSQRVGSRVWRIRSSQPFVISRQQLCSSRPDTDDTDAGPVAYTHDNQQAVRNCQMSRHTLCPTT